MIPRLLKRVIQDGTKSILILGPRQTGKSTLIASMDPDYSINLNDETTFLELKSNPNLLKEILDAKKPKTVLIDEIQRDPSLLNTIQVILDAQKKKAPRFYLTGSSARKLKRGQANLLPGRIFSYELGGLCAAELDHQLNVKKSIRHGFLPEPYLEEKKDAAEKLLSTYSGIYLKEEIMAEALTRNLDGFSRFLFSAAKNAGLVLDFSKLAKQAKIERKICTRFYEILEDTLLAYRIEIYEETNADVVKRPKFYFFDVGVLNGLLQNFSASQDRIGHLFEHAVVNQIYNSAKAFDVPIKLSYFRTRGGYEVDLILELKNKTYAIEVKSGVVDVLDVSKLLQLKEYSKKIDEFFIVIPEGLTRKIREVEICSLNELMKKVGF